MSLNGRRVRFADSEHSSPRSDRGEATLCNVCKSIDFSKYQYEGMSGYICLGRWCTVQRKVSCSFCRLVVRAFKQQLDKVPWHRDDQILLTNYLSWEMGVEMSPYDRLRSDSYSNKFDLRSMAKKFNYAAYRLLVYVRDNHQRFGLIQYMANDGDIANGKGQFHGRLFDQTKVNVELLRSWLDRCEKFHLNICENDGSVSRRLPPDLRLIEVASRCLVRAPTSRLCYLTLSYVWGGDDMHRDTGMKPVELRRQDLRTTAGGKELTPLPERLPQTIEDAILVTRQLGFRYLWVDALCIIQDDPIEDRKVHLENMDAIYNCSELTIVAGSGIHADTGLPGISIPRNKVSESEGIGSLEMQAMSPSFSDLENSKLLVWNTRGWTFQEKVFAKRLLLFTDYQVYFRCSESVWTEEVVMETEDPSKSVEARPGKYRWAPDRQPYIPSRKLLLVKSFLPKFDVNDEWSYLGNFPDYAAAIREYSQRRLTRKEDKLDAIKGILRSLQVDSGDFIHGLPETDFLQSLLWHPEQGSRCIRENDHLPSWTWAAWCFETGVVFDVLDIRVIRTVLLLIRHLYHGCKKLAQRIGKAMESDSDSPSHDYSSSSTDYSSSNTTSSSSSGSSAPGIPLIPPVNAAPPRDWTTLNAMGKASMNISACFGLPLLFRHHTVKQVFLYDKNEARRLMCEEPLTMANFTRDEHTNKEKAKIAQARASKSVVKLSRVHAKIASGYRRPVLAMTSAVVEFLVGSSLDHPLATADDQVGCYELLDNSHKCIGEIWTTRKQAEHGRSNPLKFITISWGLSLAKAEIAKQYVPQWDFDAAILPKSRTNMLMKACSLFEEVMNWTSAKHLSASYGLQDRKAVEQQPSLTSFFDALLTAHKGEPRPKFLWSTVNVLQVKHVGDDQRHGRDGIPVFKRIGVGRVIFDAWLASSSPSQEVILA